MNDVKLANEEAERSIIGSVLLKQDSIYRIIGKIQPSDFYRQQYAITFDSMLAMAREKKPIDVVTIASELNAKGVLEKVGGIPFITHTADSMASSANIEYYARLVLDMSRRRQGVAAAERLKASAEDLNADFSISNAQQKLSDIAMRNTDGIASMSQNMLDFGRWIDEKGRTGWQGVPTGFSALEVYTHGWQPQSLNILAARPSMGKTALMLNLAANAASRGKSVLIISLEMNRRDLISRMVSSEGAIENEHLRVPVKNGKATMNKEEGDRYVVVMDKMSKWNMAIVERDASQPDQIEGIAREVQGKQGLDLICIDYMQLMSGKYDKDRVQEVSYISRALKLLAKNLNVPVLALSQLSRAVESRSDKRPILSDLRESGSIEQDADTVMFLYRDDYYKHNGNPDTELIIAKNRNGTLGTVNLMFLPKYTKFISAGKSVEVPY